MRSISELLAHFESQHVYYSNPLLHQSKGAIQHDIESVMSLKATCEMKEDILKDLIEEGGILQGGIDLVGNLVCAEWQEHVDVLCTTIKQLTKQIDDKCSTLNAKDDSGIELQKAEKNGWAIRFANLHVLKEQLLCKL